MQTSGNHTEIAVLFGAGVSFRPPTCLPLGGELLGRLWSALKERVHRSWPSVILPAWRGTWPPFEVVLGELDSVVPGSVTSLLRSFTAPRPNVNHHLLAHLARHGVSLLTTNFDTNVEAAVRARGLVVEVLAADRDPVATPGRIHLLKLHGCASRPRTVVATAAQLARRGRGTSPYFLSRRKTSSFDALCQGRVCFVIGYSGSDHLDIIPHLRTYRKAIIVWVRHRPTRSAAQSWRLQELRHLATSRRRDSFDLSIAVPDTTRFLAELCRRVGLRAPRGAPDAAPSAKTRDLTFVDRTVRRISADDAFWVACRILQRASRTHAVQRLLASAHGTALPNRVRVEVDLNIRSVRLEGRALVASLTALLRECGPGVPREARGRIHLSLSRELNTLGRYQAACDHARQALRLTTKRAEDSLDALAIYYMSLAQLGEFERALHGLARMYPKLKRSGQIHTLCECHNTAAVVLSQLDQFRPAAAMFQKAALMARFLGEHEIERTARTNRANALFHLRRADEARNELREVLDAPNTQLPTRRFALMLKAHDLLTRRDDWRGAARTFARVATLCKRAPFDDLQQQVLGVTQRCYGILYRLAREHGANRGQLRAIRRRQLALRAS